MNSRFSTASVDRRCRELLPRMSVYGSELVSRFLDFLFCLIYLERRSYVLTCELDEVKAKLDSLKPRSLKRAEYVKQRKEQMNAIQSVRRSLITKIHICEVDMLYRTNGSSCCGRGGGSMSRKTNSEKLGRRGKMRELSPNPPFVSLYSRFDPQNRHKAQ
jgi:hypothetical protein